MLFLQRNSISCRLERTLLKTSSLIFLTMSGRTRPRNHRSSQGSRLRRGLLEAWLLEKWCYFQCMGRFTEIENAITALPTSEQQLLLHWLQTVVNSTSPKQPGTKDRRQAWLHRLEERRARGATSESGSSIQQMMNDLRGN